MGCYHRVESSGRAIGRSGVCRGRDVVRSERMARGEVRCRVGGRRGCVSSWDVERHAV
jgi:hypothetical protein